MYQPNIVTLFDSTTKTYLGKCKCIFLLGTGKTGSGLENNDYFQSTFTNVARLYTDNYVWFAKVKENDIVIYNSQVFRAVGKLTTEKYCKLSLEQKVNACVGEYVAS